MEAASATVKNSFYHPQHLLICSQYAGSSIYACAACELTVTGTGYGCKECGFSIHEACLKGLPESHALKHHPQHELTLTRLDASRSCDLCKETSHAGRYLYRCVPCDYAVHPRCTKLVVVEQPQHQPRKEPQGSGGTTNHHHRHQEPRGDGRHRHGILGGIVGGASILAMAGLRMGAADLLTDGVHSVIYSFKTSVIEDVEESGVEESGVEGIEDVEESGVEGVEDVEESDDKGVEGVEDVESVADDEDVENVKDDEDVEELE